MPAFLLIKSSKEPKDRKGILTTELTEITEKILPCRDAEKVAYSLEWKYRFTLLYSTTVYTDSRG